MQRQVLTRPAAAVFAASLLVATLGATGGQRHGAPTSALVAHAALELNAGHHLPGATHLPPGTMQLEPAQRAHAHMLANGAPPGDFPFQTTQSADGLIYIHSYGQYPSFGSDFLGEVQQSLRERVQPRLGYGLRARVDIYTYNSRGDFLAGAQPESPQITGAYSLFSPSQIYMPLYYGSADMFDILSHELTHITFHQSVDVGHLEADFRTFPLWFDEGLAVSDESTTSPGYGVYRAGLMQSVRNGGRYLDVFNQFVWAYPQDPDTDDLAYAESGAFLTWLGASVGPEHFHQFIADAANGDLNSASAMDIGADLTTVQSQWEGTLGKPALQHAAGILPSRTTVTPYTPAHEPALAARVKPYGVGGGSGALLTALVEVGAGTAATLVALAVSALWLRRRRQVWRRRRSSPPLIDAAPTATDSAAIAAPAITANATELPASNPPSTSAVASEAAACSGNMSASAPPPLAAPDSTTDELPAPVAPKPQRTPWLEQVALALAPPVALGAGLLWLLLEPARLWRHAMLAGAGAALLLSVAVGLLAWRAWRGRRLFVAHAVTAIALLVLAVVTSTHIAADVGLTEARGYEQDAAYTLALTAYADAGAPAATLARVHSAWADIAYGTYHDYSVATAQYRAAIALAGSGGASRNDRATLLKMTLEWGRSLSDAHQFQQAAQVYASQYASPSCASDCRASVEEKGSGVYLAWAADLIAQKQPDAALAQLKALGGAFPKGKAAASAQLTLAQQSQGLAGAWVARKASDVAAMNLLLALVAVRTQDPLQLALAAEAPEPLTGKLASTYFYKAHVHIYFLAFRSQSDAQAFTASTHHYPDTSVFKAATQTDDQGNFTVWLAAGYSYVPIWEAPAQGGEDNYYYWSRSIVTVAPFAQGRAGFVLGT